MAQLRYACARMPVIAADAAVLPLRPGTLAAVSAVMCHTDIDDYAAVCRALSPALQPGGIFAHVGVHPCYIGAFADRSSPAGIVITPGYWRRERRFEAWSARGVRAKVGATHLPLADLLNALTRAGLTIEQVAELGSPPTSWPSAPPARGKETPPNSGTIWGPHAMHEGRQAARERTVGLPPAASLNGENAYSTVLGVKGSRVQIPPSRLVRDTFRLQVRESTREPIGFPEQGLSRLDSLRVQAAVHGRRVLGERGPDLVPVDRLG